MEWAYNSRMECWISQVGMSGTFKLTREEKLNNATVGGVQSAYTHRLVADSPGQKCSAHHASVTWCWVFCSMDTLWHSMVWLNHDVLPS